MPKKKAKAKVKRTPKTATTRRAVPKQQAAARKRHTAKTLRKKKTRKKNAQAWKGNEALKPFLLPISKLKQIAKNARRHGPGDVEAIAASLKEFGQQTPIVVDEKFVIRKGNGTMMAAHAVLDWTHIAAIKTDIDERMKLSLYSITDNRTAELSSWDIEILSKELQSMDQKLDLEATKLWKDYELAPLLNAEWKPPKVDEMPTDSSEIWGDSMKLTNDQRKVIDAAVSLVREKENDKDMSEGRCVELICGNFMAGPYPG